LRENDCLAFVRAYFDDRVLVILNRSKASRDVAIDPSPEITKPQLKNLLTGEDIALKEGKISMNVPAMSAAFIAIR